MNKIIKSNYYFFSFFLIYLIILGSLISAFPKGGLELWINDNNSPFLDFFFKYYTFVGDGIFYAIVCVALFFYKKIYALLGLICFAVTGLSAQLFKKIIFKGVPRPKAFFNDDSLHFVDGVNIALHNSFPSGHTTTAFSMFCLLALLFTNKKWAFPLLFLAVLAGFSRVYLMLHFFEDVFFGSILGTVLTVIIFWVFDKKFNK